MNFDPQKPFGKCFGVIEDMPGACFTQGAFYYDSRRKCINPLTKEAESNKTNTTIADATETLRDKAAKAADVALVKLQAAKAANEDKGTASSKGAYTKALNAYTKAQEKLDKLAE